MFRRLQNLTTSLDSQPWDLQTYSIKNAIEISIFLRFAHRSCWKIQLAIRSQCMGKLFSFQVWYMSDLHYRISAVKTAIEMQKFLASSEFWHSKWRLPGTPKNQVFHYGFLRGSHGKLWCSHGLRTGSPKPGFFWNLRVLFGFWSGFYGFCSDFYGVRTGFARVAPFHHHNSSWNLEKTWKKWFRIQNSKHSILGSPAIISKSKASK